MLLAWENEAYLVLEEFGADKFEIVYPPTSILAEPPVAVVDKNVEAKGTPRSPRPISNTSIRRGPDDRRPRTTTARRKPDLVADQDLAGFPKIELVTIDDPLFGGWEKAQPKHFGDGGIFDQIYTRPSRPSDASATAAAPRARGGALSSPASSRVSG